ncbi:MAG: GMC family oxidoreductase N-terminal domain-containing protein [Terriglobus roseus]|nr:GMC family oxidoreductase N-terminal domain-containing protein [Terriglobus roseus]
MAIVAGQAWGGGGTVNWSASLQTQGYVRKEWADKGMPFFTSAEFQTCLDRVCDRMGVSANHVEQNPTNAHLLEGARKLGWTHKPVPQNTGGTKHYCGYCTLGCGSCEKQGPMVSFLPDAAKKGTQFIEGFDCREVIFETIDKIRTAVGVKGVWTSRDENGGVAGATRVSREVIIRAKRVIISGGTMQSPLLLLRSGIKNYHIGRNLKTHPVSFVGAVYPEETRPWEGGILTAVVNEFENLDGQGHGSKLEATTMLPSLFLGFPPWRGGLDWKLFAAKFSNMVGYISLARDSGSGQVYPDPKDGRARYRYLPNAKDKKHITEGLIGLAKIAYVEGASEIFTAIPAVPVFKRTVDARPQPAADGSPDDGINDPAFNAWLDQIRKAGLPDADVLFLSAHQMGTCRMGTSAKNSVVDPKGKVWGTENLYVADASVFPSASGVNPMITNMAISDWISRGIDRELRQGSQVPSRL